MDIEELKKLVALMNKNDLCELEIESEGSKVRLKKAQPTVREVAAPQFYHMAPAHAAAPQAAPAPALSHHLPGVADKSTHAPVVEGGSKTFNSPMVGTFYASPSPTADPFVKVGDRVGQKTVLCIIEAMKVMNEITADIDGEILEVFVANGEAVEYGQPLFTIRPTK